MLPMLERLAGAGFFAVSIDPWQHGDRSTESLTHLRDRLIGAFRRDMWPVILTGHAPACATWTPATATSLTKETPTAYGRWLYAQLNPITHPEHFAHGPAILFESGQDDTHVPGEAAHRFATALPKHSPTAGQNITVHVAEGLAHIESVRNPDVIDRCVHWLSIS